MPLQPAQLPDGPNQQSPKLDGRHLRCPLQQLHLIPRGGCLQQRSRLQALLDGPFRQWHPRSASSCCIGTKTVEACIAYQRTCVAASAAPKASTTSPVEGLLPLPLRSCARRPLPFSAASLFLRLFPANDAPKESAGAASPSLSRQNRKERQNRPGDDDLPPSATLIRSDCLLPLPLYASVRSL
ncbi:hypothetical protein C4D60_Mb02t19100 [Musa balbisiana]|uniref:Uncharacterized protein n=1 Tax=Musa balbisiana TaxID=52838 RepID=A0A4S8ID52_MUSBA|nr:hypothetical protein C4D60_Mb02t19100 [Musa balbisiana]